jgi:hypothetical protein
MKEAKNKFAFFDGWPETLLEANNIAKKTELTIAKLYEKNKRLEGGNNEQSKKDNIFEIKIYKLSMCQDSKRSSVASHTSANICSAPAEHRRSTKNENQQ